MSGVRSEARIQGRISANSSRAFVRLAHQERNGAAGVDQHHVVGGGLDDGGDGSGAAFEAAVVGEVQQETAGQDESHVQVAIAHELAGHSQPGRGVCRVPQILGQGGVPFAQLAIEGQGFVGGQAGVLGEAVLDPVAYVAEQAARPQRGGGVVIGEQRRGEERIHGAAVPAAAGRATESHARPGVEAEEAPPGPATRLGAGDVGGVFRVVLGALSGAAAGGFSVQAQGYGDAVGGAEHSVGHVGGVAVVKIVATQQTEGLEALHVARTEGVQVKIDASLFVVLYVQRIAPGGDGAQGEDHVEEGEPGAVVATARCKGPSEVVLVKDRGDGVDVVKVELDAALLAQGVQAGARADEGQRRQQLGWVLGLGPHLCALGCVLFSGGAEAEYGSQDGAHGGDAEVRAAVLVRRQADGVDIVAGADGGGLLGRFVPTAVVGGFSVLVLGDLRRVVRPIVLVLVGGGGDAGDRRQEVGL
ncbi:hypothetical protein ColKHC_03165 [Colletotrichum higginsianum]|nr:hypothetical protein ColKHC_03165 [Colletotrichum higginsianum]